ncbi:hypothetical protein NZK35_12435 [Stieleria sp. ICT_E10.1]|uniref:hypothetical protein n=1 Tax=Stieleria sedimenti TaxID=2976331 RepID=UPI00217FC65B|nr:hypothetical protein [Stieleria sedimenti]MCS7467454.1 hypothetical protein [Stieleria sedimenti]
MKPIPIPKAGTASNRDWIGPLIEVIWQSGRAIFLVSLGCVVGVIVFSQLGVVAWLIGSFTSLPTKQIVDVLPATGWFVGFLVGLFQTVSSLKKSFRAADDEETAELDDDRDDEDATAPESPLGSASPDALSDPIGFKAKSIRTLREGGIGLLLGLILGMFLSLYLIIVSTAGILSPMAPASWRDGFRMQATHQQGNDSPPRRLRRSNRDDGISSGAEFWHPVYGSILKWTVPAVAIAGCVFCIVAKEEKIE